MKNISLIAGIGLVMVSALSAQETPPVAFNVGGGFTQTLGGTGQRLNNGWNFDGGLGYNVTPYVGFLGQFNFNQFDINSTTLNALGFPGGDVSLWSLTLNPIVHTNPRGPVDLYFIGGGGLYHRRQEFTQPSSAVFTGFDPFFGLYQVAVPATQVLTSYAVNKPGINGGIGLAFGTRWHVKVYAEARYHRMFLGNDRHTDILPVTFGVRW
jgi:opacity protein-like surface antigen